MILDIFKLANVHRNLSIVSRGSLLYIIVNHLPSEMQIVKTMTPTDKGHES